MEVFLRNVPQDLTDDALKRELQPYMNTLGITAWTCDKPRKRAQAWVTFLRETDGRKFLNKHEKIRKKPQQSEAPPTAKGVFKPRAKVRDIARLHLLGTAIYAEKSTRAVDKHLLSHLEHDREQKAKASARDPEAPALSLTVSNVRSGDNFFDGPHNTLSFAEQATLASEFDMIAGRFGQSSFTLTIVENGLGSKPDFRLEIPYDKIQDLVVGYSDKSFVFVLMEPPRMYRAIQGEDGNANWERIGSFPTSISHAEHVGTALVYRMKVISRDFQEIVTALKSRNHISITRHDLPVLPNFSVIGREDVNQLWGKRVLEHTISKLRAKGILPFALLFQVQALVWNNYLRPWSGHQMLDILEKVALDAKEMGVYLAVTADSIKQLFQRIPYPCPGTDPVELDVKELVVEVMRKEYDLRNEDPERDEVYGSKIPSQQAWVFKAMVTPTRILLHGPDAESRNRVLRMFPKHNDYFLRVIFCDEDGQDLSFNPKISNDFVFNRYRQVLRDGIVVGGREFSFLGFSHSSLRSHSAWFLAPFTDDEYQKQNYDTILRSLGDFKDIRIPAKCAARIGQAFSETPYAIPLIECGILNRAIPDVKSADGTRVFSDGVGTISRGALEAIWPYLGRRSAAPTCLQIRWGGCKGMLSVDSRLPGKMFCVRTESMMKFPSTDLAELGICDTSSKPLRLVLNRQMIKIMEDMGTADKWFYHQQNRALDILRAVTAKAINTSTFLEYQAIGINLGLPKLIKQLDKMGIDYRRDRFLKSAVELVVLRELRLLKHKARIPIDKGVTLFGIMDETGFLQEGQVYIAYDKTYGISERRINATLADGQVLVTRSPALHPGDIQLAQMITPPLGHPLRDLQNCIVFSQRGSRDLPSQLSGGDLDGDLYNVIWDPEAMPKRTFDPADYPRVKPPELDRPVTRDDIADFFINFMKTDILGMIAVRHVMIADKEDRGTLDPTCITLAEMHSTAVDFSKTGIPVNPKQMPKGPRIRPDFLAPAPPLKFYDRGQIDHIGEFDDDDDGGDSMGRIKFRYYLSEKILGRLYRNVDERKIWDESIHLDINMDGPSVWDQLLGLVEAQIAEYKFDIVYSRKTEEAWKIRNLYESTISDNMWQFSDNPRSPISEVEVFCGFILNKRGSQTRRQRDSSTKLKEEMDRIMAWIVKLIRDRGMGNGGDAATSATGPVAEPNRWREDVIELCWACVAVGCGKEGGSSPLYYGTGKLQSFRVVAACCLLKEWNNLSRKMDWASGGGYLGTARGRRRPTILPIR
ncbi:Fc.00g008240.m01.CDS01 [Cosmosporella sp. VM-42]